jgi:hypothetical protein
LRTLPKPWRSGGRRDRRNRAYTELKKAAEKTHTGIIDITNIVISGGFSISGLAPLGSMLLGGAVAGAVGGEGGVGVAAALTTLVSAPFVLLTNTQRITATGDMVVYNNTTDSNPIIWKNVQEIMAGISGQLIETLPVGSVVAVVNVSSNDRALSGHSIDELEFYLVDSKKFAIVDRARLDLIRSEHNFQMSGEVSEDSAVAIGNMLGATIVLVGAISPGGSGGRITIRALDVKTAQIVAMARGIFDIP